MKRIAQNVRSVLGMVRPVWLELRVVAEDEAGGTGWGGVTVTGLGARLEAA